MSADYSDAFRDMWLKMSPDVVKAMDLLTKTVTSEAVERVFGEWSKTPLPVRVPKPALPVQEPVSHLLLGRSEPVRLPSGAFACWDDPLAGDEDEEDDEPVPSLRRPVPITIANVDQELLRLSPPPGFAELSAWLDKVQQDVQRAFAMPSWAIRTDPGFRAMVRDTPMDLVIAMEGRHGR